MICSHLPPLAPPVHHPAAPWHGHCCRTAVHASGSSHQAHLRILRAFQLLLTDLLPAVSGLAGTVLELRTAFVSQEAAKRRVREGLPVSKANKV